MLVSDIHLKSPFLYLFCTTKVFPKFLLPFESEASFQSEDFGSNDYMHHVAVTGRGLFIKSCTKKTPVSIKLVLKERPINSNLWFTVIAVLTSVARAAFHGRVTLHLLQKRILRILALKTKILTRFQ